MATVGGYWGGVWYRVGGYWVGIPGEYYPATARVLEEVSTSEAGPVSPCKGLEWVG